MTADEHVRTAESKSASLRELRECEIRQIFDLLPPRGKVLEIGAGPGWQAKCMEGEGYSVDAIDVSPWPNAVRRVEPFNGMNLPFDEDRFDVVYTSNVLDHVEVDLGAFHEEISRVLRPSGILVHVVPTSSWRFWTNVAYYPRSLISALKKSLGRNHSRVESNSVAQTNPPPFDFHRLIPPTLGERGNALTELLYFNRLYRKMLFVRLGWNVVTRRSLRLFYTGYSDQGRHTPLGMRQGLSLLLGSSSSAFVLAKADPRDEKR